MGTGETPRHSTWQSLKTFCVISVEPCVILTLPAWPVLRTFMQYSITFCSQQEEASEVISSIFVSQTVPSKRANNFVIQGYKFTRNLLPSRRIWHFPRFFFVITADWKLQVTLLPVALYRRTVWISVQNWRFLGQTVLEILVPLTSLHTNDDRRQTRPVI